MHMKTFGLPLTMPMMTSACVTRRQDSRCQVFPRHCYTALVPGKSKEAHSLAPFSLPNSSHSPSPFLYKGPTDGCGSIGKQVLASCIAVHAGRQDIPSTGTSTPLSSAALSSTPHILQLYLPCNLSETDQVMGSSEMLVDSSQVVSWTTPLKTVCHGIIPVRFHSDFSAVGTSQQLHPDCRSSLRDRGLKA